MGSEANAVHREPWNKGKIVGQKAPFKLKDIWALRVRLQMANRVRELALFDLGIDSKLRGCDLVKLRVRDICDPMTSCSRAAFTSPHTSARGNTPGSWKAGLRNWDWIRRPTAHIRSEGPRPR